MRKMNGSGLVVLVLLGLVLLIGTANAIFADSFQNHPDNNASVAATDTGAVWDDSNCGCSGSDCDGEISIVNYGNCNDTFGLKFYTSGGVLHYTSYAYAKSCNATYINYLSFVPVYSDVGGGDYSDKEWRVIFYDNMGYEINRTDWLSPNYLADTNHHIELIKSGSSIALYKDGVYQEDVGGTYDEDIYYFEIVTQCTATWQVILDDVSTSGDMIATIPHDWYILRNWDNPTNSGLYDGDDTKQADHVFHTTYTWEDYIGGGDTNPPADKIETIYFRTGEVVNTTSLSTSPSCGKIELNFTDMLFHEDETQDKYGLYLQKLKRGDTTLAVDWFVFDFVKYGRQTGSVSFDDDMYVASETALINVSLTSPDFDTYKFYVKVYNIFSELQEQWSVTSTSDTLEWDTTGAESGTYYVILIAKNQNTGFEYEISYDFCTINEGIRVKGVTYDAETGSELGSVSVSFKQGDTYFNTTSSSSGSYELIKMSKDIETYVSASKTNYVFNNFSFTPLTNGLYEINLYLLPDAAHISYNNTTILGLVQEYPFMQNISGATVNIWNGSSWNDSVTTTETGYFKFENLANGTYWMNATAGSHVASEDIEIETNNGSVKYQYFVLSPLYDLTVRAKRADTHESLSSFTVSVDDGEKNCTATSGACTIKNLGWGIHKVEVSASGYYVGIDYVYVGSDTETTVYLTPEEGAGIYYPPHYVRLKFQSCKFLMWFCEPIEGAEVNVTGGNTTLTGTTGTDGAVGFEMSEKVRYTLNISKDDWSYTFYLYPVKDEYVYTIAAGKATKKSIDEAINWSITTSKINDTHRYINFTYNDTSYHTSGLNYTIWKSNANKFYIYDAANRTELYNASLTNTNSYEDSYIVQNWSGNTFVVGFNATFNDSYYEPLSEYRVFKFEKVGGRLLDLGIENEFWYTVISLCLLFIVGALFSALTIEVGAVVTSGFAAILNYIGWLTYPGDKALITTAIIISILIYMNKRAKEEGVA